MYNCNKTLDSPYDPTKLAIHTILPPKIDPISNCGHASRKMVLFDDIVLFNDEENIVSYIDFDCGITFYPEAPKKVGRANGETRSTSRSCEKSQCIPSTINIIFSLWGAYLYYFSEPAQFKEHGCSSS